MSGHRSWTRAGVTTQYLLRQVINLTSLTIVSVKLDFLDMVFR
jgi:hypothetical protein